MKIQGGVSLSPELQKLISKPGPASGAPSTSFGNLLSDKIKEVDHLQKSADQAAVDFSTGKSRNLHEAILAMEMADTSLRMAINVRNKVIEAYQEVMRMPL
jgi:flagellar hook-basal body complex protein FliE